eukprot:COSAG06_NODE_5914_length_3212_cov_10.855445_2_plen_242_part_00
MSRSSEPSVSSQYGAKYIEQSRSTLPLAPWLGFVSGGFLRGRQRADYRLAPVTCQRAHGDGLAVLWWDPGLNLGPRKPLRNKLLHLQVAPLQARLRRRLPSHCCGRPLGATTLPSEELGVLGIGRARCVCHLRSCHHPPPPADQWRKRLVFLAPRGSSSLAGPPAVGRAACPRAPRTAAACRHLTAHRRCDLASCPQSKDPDLYWYICPCNSVLTRQKLRRQAMAMAMGLSLAVALRSASR